MTIRTAIAKARKDAVAKRGMRRLNFFIDAQTEKMLADLIERFGVLSAAEALRRAVRMAHFEVTKGAKS